MPVSSVKSATSCFSTSWEPPGWLVQKSIAVAGSTSEKSRSSSSSSPPSPTLRSEEHTSELQSRGHLVCRLLLEKKKETGLQDDESTPYDIRHSILSNE